MEHKMFRIDYNVETGKVSKIQLTSAEIEEKEEQDKAFADLVAKKNAAEASKVAEKLLLLEKLGITEEEARLLIS